MHALASLLRTDVLGRAQEHHAALDSTHVRALAWASEGAPHGAVVTADVQHAGRGRLQRTWEAALCSSVLASVVLRMQPVPQVGLVLGLSVAQALQDLGVQDVALKWPNDVRIGARKVAGILCEGRLAAGDAVLVASVGINVTQVRFTGMLADTATSLHLAGHPQVSRAALFAKVLVGFEQALLTLRAQGFAAFANDYAARCCTLGQDVRVEGVARTVVGRAVGLATDGALMVATTGGDVRVDYGEVSFADAPRPPA